LELLEGFLKHGVDVKGNVDVNVDVDVDVSGARI
jgi:hypothetical protein